jgi:hypothetical protein
MTTKMHELGEIATIFVGLPTKTVESSLSGRSGNVLTVRSLTGSTIDTAAMTTVELVDRDLEKYTVQSGDVLVSARSTTLKTAIVPEDLAGQIINATALESVAQSGTAQMNITVAGISKVMIPVPPLEIQRQIVKILEAADEAYHASIEAAENRRRIARQVVVARLQDQRK